MIHDRDYEVLARQRSLAEQVWLIFQLLWRPDRVAHTAHRVGYRLAAIISLAIGYVCATVFLILVGVAISEPYATFDLWWAEFVNSAVHVVPLTSGIALVAKVVLLILPLRLRSKAIFATVCLAILPITLPIVLHLFSLTVYSLRHDIFAQKVVVAFVPELVLDVFASCPFMIALPIAFFGVLIWQLRVASKGPPEGHCVHCGYDLRGCQRDELTERGCPECGAMVRPVAREANL